MKISKTHRRFSKELEDPKILTNPEDFLGPNWEDVINFWLHLDGLSWSKKLKMNNSFLALEDNVRMSARVASLGAAKEVVGEDVRYAAHCVNCLSIFGYATLELIAQHKLLEQGKTLTALPLCLNS
jgi:hypothetical protein